MTYGEYKVAKALAGFEKVTKRLRHGVTLIDAAYGRNNARIAALRDRNRELDEAARQANNAIRGIERLLNGESA